MYNGPDFDKLIEPFINIYQNLEHDLIVHIASHFKLYQDIGFKNSMKWYIKKVEELGGLNQETIEVISKQTNIPKSKIINMLKEVGISTLNIEDIQKANAKGIFNVNIDELINSNNFNDIINNSYKEIDGIFKLIHTKAIESTKQTYMDVLNQAYTEVRSGIDYNTAIRKSLTRMANQGITVVTYKQKDNSIIKYGIESCVRRDILTAVVQSTNRMSDNFCKEAGYEYVIVSKHLGARDTGTHDYKDHSWWQGKIYKIDGYTKEYPNFQKTCNEGDVQGFAGANCRHIKFGYIPGISTPLNSNINEAENEKTYELSQIQRNYENKIKKYKRQIDTAIASDDNEKVKEYKDKLKNVDKEYNDFCDKNNLKRKYSREQIIEQSNDKSNYTDVTKEWIDNATPNSHKVQDMQYFEHNGVKYNVDGKNVVLDYSKGEKEAAEWLENTFGGELYMIPRINNPEGIKTPDYIFRGNKWDLKTINGSGKQVLYHSVYKKSGQSNNFIFDVSTSKLNMNEIIQQIDKLYKRKDIPFINEIIVKKGNDFLIFKRK